MCRSSTSSYGSGWNVMIGLASSSRSYGLTRTQPPAPAPPTANSSATKKARTFVLFFCIVIFSSSSSRRERHGVEQRLALGVDRFGLRRAAHPRDQRLPLAVVVERGRGERREHADAVVLRAAERRLERLEEQRHLVHHRRGRAIARGGAVDHPRRRLEVALHLVGGEQIERSCFSGGGIADPQLAERVHAKGVRGVA